MNKMNKQDFRTKIFFAILTNSEYNIKMLKMAEDKKELKQLTQEMLDETFSIVKEDKEKYNKFIDKLSIDDLVELIKKELW